MTVSDISTHALAQDILSPDPQQVLGGLRRLWEETLPLADRKTLLEILKIVESNLPEPARYARYQEYLVAHPSITDRMNAAQLMHKWADIVRAAHEFAHRNGVSQRLGNEKMLPGQSVHGALRRAFDLLQKPEASPAQLLQRLDDGVFSYCWYVQTTPHPTHTTGTEYRKAFQALRLGLGDFALNDAAISEIDAALREITGVHSVIRLEKRTATEEVDESFVYAANGLRGSAHAAFKLREAIRDRLSGRADGYHTQLLYRYMIALMGGWESADADGNPARLAEDMRASIESDFERIRQWVVSSLEDLKNRTRVKAPLDRLINRLTCDSEDPDALNYQTDPTGEQLYAALKEVSEGQLDYDPVRVGLKKLCAMVHKCGWFWRRGDIRQSADIHAGICELLEEGMDWEGLKSKISDLQNWATDEKSQKLYGVYWETLSRLDIYQEYPDAMRQYIISNYAGVQGFKDLRRIIRLKDIHSGLQICLLHETAQDLIRAPDYLEEICHDPEFEEYLGANNYRFTIKIALSDTQREAGPAAYFLQVQTPVNCMLRLMEINRQRQAQGLHAIQMDLQYGGSDDLVRGGNDNANYLQEFVRNLKGAAELNGYSQQEIREALGPNFNATNQGRQRVATLGDRYSAERTMERHAAQVIGAAAFLQHNHDPEEMQKFQKEYEANRRAKNIICEPLIGYYKAYRGGMRNAVGNAVTSMNEVSKQNDGCRPDTRPGAAPDWTETRAITNDFADQLGGLRLTGWLGLHRLYEQPIEDLQHLYRESSQFRDWLFRITMILANVGPMDSWRRSGHPELRPCCFTQMEKYYQAIETPLLERAKGSIGTEKMTDAECQRIITEALSSHGVEDRPENRAMMLLSHSEFAMRKAAGVIEYVMTGQNMDVMASPSALLHSFPNVNGGGERYQSNAAKRIFAEIRDLHCVREFASAILSTPEMIENRYGPYHCRPAEWTTLDQLEKTCGSLILTCNQTPSAYLDSSAAEGELHLARAKATILPEWQKFNARPRKPVALAI